MNGIPFYQSNTFSTQFVHKKSVDCLFALRTGFHFFSGDKEHKFVPRCTFLIAREIPKSCVQFRYLVSSRMTIRANLKIRLRSV